MRKLFALIALIAVAAGVWYLARTMERRNDLEATIVFDDPVPLIDGAAVVVEGEVVGSVDEIASLEKRQAVSIRVAREHRNVVLSDSLFRASDDGSMLEIVNDFAVGAPVEDGAVIRARNDRLSKWLMRHGEKIGPLVRSVKESVRDLKAGYDSGTLQKQLDAWKGEIPEWKERGDRYGGERLAEIESQMSEWERDLREAGRNVDADELRAKVDGWLASAREALASDEKR